MRFDVDNGYGGLIVRVTKMERLVNSDAQREAATMTGYSSYMTGGTTAGLTNDENGVGNYGIL